MLILRGGVTMTDYVFDAEPLISLRYDEPGAGRVEEILEDVYDGEPAAAMSAVTAAEVEYVVGRIEESLNAGRRTVRNHVDGGVAIEPVSNHRHAASRIKMSGGISLGDAFSAGLAHSTDATLVIRGDEEFDDLPVSVSIERI
jgi:uncharacterized protein with PIN domain